MHGMWSSCSPKSGRGAFWFPWPLLIIAIFAISKGHFPWWLLFVAPALFFWPVYFLMELGKNLQRFGESVLNPDGAYKRKNDEDYPEKPKRDGEVRYVATSDGEFMELRD